MENNNWVFMVLIVLSILFWRDHHKLNDQIVSLNYQVSDLEDENSNLTDSLDQCNSNIEDAQSYAWSSYEEMGDALDNLETVN